MGVRMGISTGSALMERLDGAAPLTDFVRN
jgi:hypothetical protein